jgi:phosphoribosylaminoimidazolecarboxamide formyltransferase/IMP cyclohydrolase
LPVIDPSCYDEIIESLKEKDMTISEDMRRRAAGKVFEHTAYYDSVISKYFREIDDIEFPESLTLPMKKQQVLRYGENPFQKAALYGDFSKIFTQVHGKELSYNNIIDIDSAAKIIIEFEKPTFAIIKHTNPCGVGVADNLKDAYDKAFATDTVSPFGGIFAMNRKVEIDTAEKIHGIFSEVLIAPEYSDEALELLMKKKARRIIVADFDNLRAALINDVRSVTGGFLFQNTDTQLEQPEDWKVVSKRQPTPEEIESLLFSWIIAKHVKSNSIVYTRADRTLAIGAGQMSRVDSARIAAEKAKIMGLDLTASTVASDAFFPFADGLEQCVEAGATAVIEPGGSVRDEEVIKAADEKGIALVFTGNRHFKH